MYMYISNIALILVLFQLVNNIDKSKFFSQVYVLYTCRHIRSQFRLYAYETGHCAFLQALNTHTVIGVQILIN